MVNHVAHELQRNCGWTALPIVAFEEQEVMARLAHVWA
jgi:hypothetical protein